MDSLASKLIPKAVQKLIPYQSARRLGGSGDIWLNANELDSCCQYGDPSEGINNHYHRYPDFLPHETAQAYQQYCLQFSQDLDCQTVAVRGADEAIDLLIRTFCEPGNDQILVCPPTYGMYEFCADAFAVKTQAVPLLDNFQLDVSAIKTNLQSSTLLFICSPGNPTGNVIQQQDIIEILEASKHSTLVVVDEAYIEFCPQSSVLHLMATYPHLIVIRTLSKAFGLASIRCGFLLASGSVMDYVNLLIAPYPIPDPTAEIAIKALSQNGLIAMQQQTQAVLAVKDWFITELKQLTVVEHVYCSETNFVLVRFNSLNNPYEHLISSGIVARDQAHIPELNNCVRITIGSESNMQETITVLKKLN